MHGQPVIWQEKVQQRNNGYQKGMVINMSYNIAIDGPAGAGKKYPIAKLIAKKNYIYVVDTGAMYRAMALYFLEAGISADDQGKIESSVDQIDVTITYENGSR